MEVKRHCHGTHPDVIKTNPISGATGKNGQMSNSRRQNRPTTMTLSTPTSSITTRIIDPIIREISLSTTA